MSLCAPTPVQTLYETRVVTNPSTSFTSSTTTVSPEFTTIRSSSCIGNPLVIGNSSFCFMSTGIDSTSTVHGPQVNTVQVPVVLEVTSTQLVPTLTQFQPCSTPSDSSQPPSTPAQPSSPVDHLPNQSFFTSSFLTLSTPAPSISITTSSTTLANGQVSVVYWTHTYFQNPTSVYVLTTSLVTESSSGGLNSPVSLGSIVGGAIGGIAGLFFIATLLLFIRRRQRRVDATLQKKTRDDDDLREQALRRSKGRTKFSIDVEPKPYQYGVIGHSSLSPGLGQSSSRTRLLMDASPTTPSSDLFAATPTVASHSWSQPSTRLSSISVHSLSPASNVQQTTSIASDDAIGCPCTPEIVTETPRISMSFDNDPPASPVSVQWPRNLVAVNRDEDE